ncbi:hypothetical protein [Streptomyces sp. NPDC004284]|uniref:hypothetical protein n=1 Tax=Streptomyces sp. NPDC004284 TaxID=3364695 RepID=UPI00367720CE
MRDNDTAEPEPAGTGRSADGIAPSSERKSAPETNRAQGARGAGRAPQYPGEATEPDEAGPADGDAVTKSTTGTDTSTHAERGVSTASVLDERSVDDLPQLLSAGDEETFRTRWHELQSQFVDDPRQAVHEADSLVADVMQKTAAAFADHRKSLEAQWRQGEDVDTESLRTALRRYRSFFHRLLGPGIEEERQEATRSGAVDAAGRERAVA